MWVVNGLLITPKKNAQLTFNLCVSKDRGASEQASKPDVDRKRDMCADKILSYN